MCKGGKIAGRRIVAVWGWSDSKIRQNMGKTYGEVEGTIQGGLSRSRHLATDPWTPVDFPMTGKAILRSEREYGMTEFYRRAAIVSAYRIGQSVPQSIRAKYGITRSDSYNSVRRKLIGV